MIQQLSEMMLFLNYCIFSGSAEALVRCSGVYRNLERGGHGGVWGLAPSGVQGQRPGEGSGGRSPPEAERFPLKLFVKLCNI